MRGPIHAKCPTCDKVAQVKSETQIGLLRLVTYTCEHSFSEYRPITERTFYESLETMTHKKLFNFQIDGCLFLEAAGLRGLIADEMGLGKTMQFLAVMKAHKEAVPFLVLCKSSLKLQWFRAIIEWCGPHFGSQVVDTSRESLYRGFKSYIMGMDLLRRFEIEKLISNIKDVGVKTICIDECQHIKNSEAKRTGVIRQLCAATDNVVALSGTPIKNNAAEYFPVLNILRPDKFPSKKNFAWDWVDTFNNGYGWKYGGLKRPDKFKEFTNSFIIRREREEVMPDLPSISRRFQFTDLGDEVEQAYKIAFQEFQSYYNVGQYLESNTLTRHTNLMGYLSKMRQLTGIAKVDQAIEFVGDFLETTNRKIVIFVHHKTVGVALKTRITNLCYDRRFEAPLSLTSELNSDARDRVVTQFTTGETRVLIASTLASGEGLNLQACSDCLMLERQWNPANEEQAECRFIRIGQTADSVFATYIIAVGTIDEFFTEIVEAKREMFSQTMGGEPIKWDETAMIQELSKALAEKGGKKWGW